MLEPQDECCYLCDTMMPWQIVYDFSEPVCRQCVHYEGRHKMQTVIDSVREIKRAYYARMDGSAANDVASASSSPDSGLLAPFGAPDQTPTPHQIWRPMSPQHHQVAAFDAPMAPRELTPPGYLADDTPPSPYRHWLPDRADMHSRLQFAFVNSLRVSSNTVGSPPPPYQRQPEPYVPSERPIATPDAQPMFHQVVQPPLSSTAPASFHIAPISPPGKCSAHFIATIAN